MSTSNTDDVIVLGIRVPKQLLNEPGELESGHTNTSLVPSQSSSPASSTSSSKISAKISTELLDLAKKLLQEVQHNAALQHDHSLRPLHYRNCSSCRRNHRSSMYCTRLPQSLEPQTKRGRP